MQMICDDCIIIITDYIYLILSNEFSIPGFPISNTVSSLIYIFTIHRQLFVIAANSKAFSMSAYYAPYNKLYSFFG